MHLQLDYLRGSFSLLDLASFLFLRGRFLRILIGMLIHVLWNIIVRRRHLTLHLKHLLLRPAFVTTAATTNADCGARIVGLGYFLLLWRQYLDMFYFGLSRLRSARSCSRNPS